MPVAVDVNLGDRSYRIDIESGLLAEIGNRIAAVEDVTEVVVITDSNVERLYFEPVSDSLVDAGVEHRVIVVPDGERSKSIVVAYEIWNKLIESRLDRKALLIALGGGVVGDLVGFVAATYVRGIRFYQVPTTLLAQVDSCIGGKTAVNLPAAKNMVGAFHQPIGVLIDPLTLHSLDDEQYKAGLGEVLKYGVSLDDFFFNFLEENTEALNTRHSGALEKIVAHCCRIKAQIVEEDEFEMTGRRMLLNYGHTFAHAFETAAGYGNVLHGIAVAIGSIYSAQLANHLRKKGMEQFQAIDDAWVERQVALYKKLGMPTSIKDVPALDGVDPEELIAIMERDKKTERKQRCFVLPTGIGQCAQCRNVDLDIVQEVLVE